MGQCKVNLKLCASPGRPVHTKSAQRNISVRPVADLDVLASLIAIKDNYRYAVPLSQNDGSLLKSAILLRR